MPNMAKIIAGSDTKFDQKTFVLIPNVTKVTTGSDTKFA
jgi:hypothetical protein